ncbi:ATP-grasp domain-containing protein [Streptomyces sp. NPDC002952]|uniref:ATP-grasp domain-containing protein n=1 Tax=Streptomyces sp. NPDC002952 TaxID=3364673 RepID=UPI00367DBFCE
MLLVIGWDPVTMETIWGLDVNCLVIVSHQVFNQAVTAAPANRPVHSVSDCRDVEQLLAVLARAGVDLATVTHVYTGAEFLLVPVAVLAQATGIKHLLDVDQALLFRDKALQKKRIRSAGLRTANSQVIEYGSLMGPAPARFPYPAILKPVAGASTVLTIRVESPDDLNAVYGVLNDADAQQAAYQLEEFIEGDELHVDGIVRGGALTFFSVSQYTKRPFDCRTGEASGSIILDAGRSAQVYEDVERFTINSLAALGLREGVFHLELFRGASGYVFGECAARPGGAFVTQAIKLKFGVDLSREHVHSLLGMPAALPRSCPEAVGWTLLAAPPGRIIRMPSLDDVLGRPGVVESSLDVKPGGIMPDMRQGSSCRAGLALLQAPNKETLAGRIDDLVAWFYEKTLVTPLM